MFRVIKMQFSLVCHRHKTQLCKRQRKNHPARSVKVSKQLCMLCVIALASQCSFYPADV
uniref:Uncharacterized protein n=1 Tax=Arundo donax TaxID=35708 RepID=A0A0A9DFA4_ARUDO